MWLDNVSQDAVNLFWQLCSEVEPFPRNLERSLALALPVALVKLPRLRLMDIESWIARRGIFFHFDSPSRAVRGCLIAFGGKGLIFVDGADPDDERRFTLAHEIAHFFLDCWQPRQRAIEKIGPAIVQVIDGYRLPNVNERVYSLLSSLPMGVQIDLLERDGNSHPDIWKIEDRAVKVALALLAPPAEVIVRTDLSAAQFDPRRANMISILRDHFGLPLPIAHAYSWSLLDAIGKGPSWVEHFRVKSNVSNLQRLRWNKE